MEVQQEIEDSRSLPELGKYHLVVELAHGGMGVVYLAACHGPGGFNKLLALKELRPELVSDQACVTMFLDEARLAARLQHKNIVQTYEVGCEDHRPYMVMEHLDGRSLSRVTRKLAERGRLPVAAHLRILAEMLEGLHYAHELRDFDGQPLDVVHRDVSPLNVFVTFDGQVKLIDFGIAKTSDSSIQTRTGIIKGQVAYMAPEQARGARVDRRADIYAAGVMLWQAVAGRRLWRGLSVAEIYTRTLREAAPPLSSVLPDAPEDLEAICARAMARRPQDRYATAVEMLADVEAHIARRSDAMSMREVGELVSEAFAEERRKTSAVVEEAIARARSGPRSGVMPTFAFLEGLTSSTPPPAANDEQSYGSVPIEAPRPTTTAPVRMTPLLPPAPEPPARRFSTWLSKSAGIAGLASGALLAAAVGLLALHESGKEGAAAAQLALGAAIAAPQATTAETTPAAHGAEPGPADDVSFHVHVDRHDSPQTSTGVRAVAMPTLTPVAVPGTPPSISHGTKRTPAAPAQPHTETAATPWPSPQTPSRPDPATGGSRPAQRPIVTSNPYGGS